MSFTFQAMWPITDPKRPLHWLIAEAMDELPSVAARAHAQLVSNPTWSVRPSHTVAGSGRITEHVLFCEADAEPMKERDYWKRTA